MQKMEVGKGDAVAEESFYDRARKKMGMEDRFAEGDDALKRDAAAPAGGGGAA